MLSVRAKEFARRTADTKKREEDSFILSYKQEDYNYYWISPGGFGLLGWRPDKALIGKAFSSCVIAI